MLRTTTTHESPANDDMALRKVPSTRASVHRSLHSHLVNTAVDDILSPLGPQNKDFFLPDSGEFGELALYETGQDLFLPPMTEEDDRGITVCANDLNSHDDIRFRGGVLTTAATFRDAFATDTSISPTRPSTSAEHAEHASRMRAHLLQQEDGTQSRNLKRRDEGGKKNKLKSMTDLVTISKYFHLSIKDASRELNICQTVLKKICRAHGISRWPARRVGALERQVEKLANVIKDEKTEADYGNPLQRQAILLNIEFLQCEKARICKLKK